MTNTALPRHSESGYFQNISVDGAGIGQKPSVLLIRILIGNFQEFAKDSLNTICILRQELLKNSDDIIFLLGKKQWLKNSSRFLEEFRLECLLRSQMTLSKDYFRSKQKA